MDDGKVVILLLDLPDQRTCERIRDEPGVAYLDSAVFLELLSESNRDERPQPIVRLHFPRQPGGKCIFEQKLIGDLFRPGILDEEA